MYFFLISLNVVFSWTLRLYILQSLPWRVAFFESTLVARPPVGAVRRGHVRSGGCGCISLSESEISGELKGEYEALH